MSVQVALDFADHPRPFGSLQAPADSMEELREALTVLAAAYRAAQEPPVRPVDADGVNGCLKVAAQALHFLADNERSAGGQDRFNSEHLYQLSQELSRTISDRSRTPALTMPSPDQNADIARRNKLRRLAATMRGNADEIQREQRHWKISHGQVYTSVTRSKRTYEFDVCASIGSREHSVHGNIEQKPFNFDRHAIRHIAACDPASIIEFCNAVDEELAAIPTKEHPAASLLAQVEERFPNWKGFRDLIDCIDVTLHQLRQDALSTETNAPSARRP